jgi:hypothetical protein
MRKSPFGSGVEFGLMVPARAARLLRFLQGIADVQLGQPELWKIVVFRTGARTMYDVRGTFPG